MKPQNIHVRVDRVTGDIWITLEQLGRPIKRLKNITDDVYLALCADLIAVDDTEKLLKQIKFADGTVIELTTRRTSPIEDQQGEAK